MKHIFRHSLFSFLIFLLISNNAIARGYGYYYPPPHGYAFAPQYHYPPPPPAYGYPHYPPFRPYPVQQQAPQVPPVSHQIDKTETRVEKSIKRTSTETHISSTAKKQQFIDLLLPHIEKENREILDDRLWLEALSSKVQSRERLSNGDSHKLHALSKAYKISTENTPATLLIDHLLTRVDIIPASLTLAQAANETGWGTSRFATEANNYFGIWTYEADKGLKPRKREADKKHFVRKFSSTAESVRYYMRMLNTHPAYDELRNIRSSLRREESKISGTRLAQGLEKYSAKGTEYIKLITLLITQNQWAQLDVDPDTASS